MSPMFKRLKAPAKGMDPESLQADIAEHLEYSLAKDEFTATSFDVYHALALTVRDRIIERWLRTRRAHYTQDAKRICYLSAEYLMGRALVNNLINLGIYDEAKEVLAGAGMSLSDLAEEEPDAALGNGGLGRLAACFLDSMAALELPAIGYGIRYEFGIFEQQIRDNCQVEVPDVWLKMGNPWEVKRPQRTFKVQFGGRTQVMHERSGRERVEWFETHDVIGVAYDTPIDGYNNESVNTLRLWDARAAQDFDLKSFNSGDYHRAVEEKNISENISKVLYPNDNHPKGQELRLKQQYFFVSCSIQDIIRRYLVTHDTFDAFPEKVAIQLNDTHPSLGVAELMRLLIDVHALPWKQAWKIAGATFAYTNHTLLSEALERWPVPLLERLLPRHLQIIYEINRRFLREVSVMYPGDGAKLGRMSLIEEGPVKKVRMAHLAIVGSHSVNGVSALHSRLLVERELKEFHEIFPGKFNNKTNGVTPRRWLRAANPTLSALITEHIGDGWIGDLNQIKALEPLATDATFQARFAAIKLANKERLAKVTQEICGFAVDPHSMFDVQVKRIHEYKRQLMNLLHIVSSWLRLKRGDAPDFVPRTFFFGGKAAPGYDMAKRTIQLISCVSEMLNQDRTTNDKLKVVFLPNYRVSLAEKIIPAAELSEQISTAGFEASGTGNMKFQMNGALTIGTMDGANVEMHEVLGDENIFIFGLSTPEVQRLSGDYQPMRYYEGSALLRETLDLISSGFFSPEDPDLFKPIVNDLLYTDRYMALADFDAYVRCQDDVGRAYADTAAWNKRAILNVARSGKFSSDRTIAEYNKDIWGATPIHVTGEKV